jgi:hypothetical protein
MGFLSRKNKSRPVAVEEPHPIVEELQRMEEAVPELGSDEGSERLPTGPVAEEDPSSSQAAGDVPSSTPPAEDAAEPQDEAVEAEPEPVAEEAEQA